MIWIVLPVAAAIIVAFALIVRSRQPRRLPDAVNRLLQSKPTATANQLFDALQRLIDAKRHDLIGPIWAACCGLRPRDRRLAHYVERDRDLRDAYWEAMKGVELTFDELFACMKLPGIAADEAVEQLFGRDIGRDDLMSIIRMGFAGRDLAERRFVTLEPLAPADMVWIITHAQNGFVRQTGWERLMAVGPEPDDLREIAEKVGPLRDACCRELIARSDAFADAEFAFLHAPAAVFHEAIEKLRAASHDAETVLRWFNASPCPQLWELLKAAQPTCAQLAVAVEQDPSVAEEVYTLLSERRHDLDVFEAVLAVVLYGSGRVSTNAWNWFRQDAFSTDLEPALRKIAWRATDEHPHFQAYLTVVGNKLLELRGHDADAVEAVMHYAPACAERARAQLERLRRHPAARALADIRRLTD